MPMRLIDHLGDPEPVTVRAFLEWWHGQPTRPPVRVEDGPLPEPIRVLASLAAVWPRAFAQNKLAAGPDLLRDQDRIVFYVENQGVYLWATDGIGRDPVVWGRFNDPGERWLAEREPLSRFLVQIVMFEAIMGAVHAASASWLSLAQLEAILEPLQQAPFGSWRWPAEPTWFYTGDDLLAIANPNGPTPAGPADRFEVFVAARRPDALAYLAEISDVEWDRPPG
jgi:hypothetical protein